MPESDNTGCHPGSASGHCMTCGACDCYRDTCHKEGCYIVPEKEPKYTPREPTGIEDDVWLWPHARKTFTTGVDTEKTNYPCHKCKKKEEKNEMDQVQ